MPNIFVQRLHKAIKVETVLLGDDAVLSVIIYLQVVY